MRSPLFLSQFHTFPSLEKSKGKNPWIQARGDGQSVVSNVWQIPGTPCFICSPLTAKYEDFGFITQHDTVSSIGGAIVNMFHVVSHTSVETF